jgi:signal transduction histidine kinase
MTEGEASVIFGLGFDLSRLPVATASASKLGWSLGEHARAFVLVTVCIAGVVATAVTAWAVASSPILVDASGDAVWRSLIVGEYVAVGAYVWWRRPESPLGAILAGVGFVWAATSLNALGAPLAYTLGMVVYAAFIVSGAYLYLCVPRGWLDSPLERRFMLGFALSVAVSWALILVLSSTLPAGSDFSNCGTNCPHNALQIISTGEDVGTALVAAADVVFAAGGLGVVMLVFHKARSPSRLRRRAVTPLALVVIASTLEFVVSLFLPEQFPSTRETLKVLNGLAGVAVPIAILVGQIRGEVFAAVSLGQIAVRGSAMAPTPAAVQTLIGDALGDSTLTLALPASGGSGYVDVEGARLELPPETNLRRVTEVTRDGRPIAALIHDASLDTDSDVVEGLAATALMLLENRQLVEELRTSRARLAATADRERRKLERDLHDGAQQRLMAIQIKLRLVEEHVRDPELAAKLDEISDDAAASVEELRALAHGIYPPALLQFGLVAALRHFSMSAHLPIEIVDEGIGRCSPATEAAIYYCAMEAMQNATKHAGSHARVTITLGRDRQRVRFAVSDDGVGMNGPSSADGEGLTGMRDRIGAVNGEVEITSMSGRGTTVMGTVPLAPSEAVLEMTSSGHARTDS